MSRRDALVSRACGVLREACVMRACGVLCAVGFVCETCVRCAI